VRQHRLPDRQPRQPYRLRRSSVVGHHASRVRSSQLRFQAKTLLHARHVLPSRLSATACMEAMATAPPRPQEQSSGIGWGGGTIRLTCALSRCGLCCCRPRMCCIVSPQHDLLSSSTMWAGLVSLPVSANSFCRPSLPQHFCWAVEAYLYLSPSHAPGLLWATMSKPGEVRVLEGLC